MIIKFCFASYALLRAFIVNQSKEGKVQGSGNFQYEVRICWGGMPYGSSEEKERKTLGKMIYGDVIVLTVDCSSTLCACTLQGCRYNHSSWVETVYNVSHSLHLYFSNEVAWRIFSVGFHIWFSNKINSVGQCDVLIQHFVSIYVFQSTFLSSILWMKLVFCLRSFINSGCPRGRKEFHFLSQLFADKISVVLQIK